MVISFFLAVTSKVAVDSILAGAGLGMREVVVESVPKLKEETLLLNQNSDNQDILEIIDDIRRQDRT